MEHLCNVATLIEADRILALLESNEIACYKMEKGSGSYLSITTGMSLYGYDIYVDKDNIEDAKALLAEVEN
ncbi:Putative signal transducing protein [Lachnospiraceae bacterium XBB1006]|nr:Putative signal transducing protein [Lachnospiraceae bacterium XBB1006]